MAVHAEINPARIAVDPGGRAQTQITVTNDGTVVDSYTLEVLGSAAAWCVCEPATLSLFPAQSGTAVLVATPPAGSGLAAGPMPFAVRIASSEDPQGSIVEEGVIDIGGVGVIHAELSPRTGRARGKRRARHQIAVDNRGNTAVVVRLTGLDDEDAVHVVCDPPELEVAPGSAAFAKVRVRAEHRFWRGPAVTRRFHVLAQPPGGAEPTRMDAALLHEAAVPGWLPKALALVTAAVIALSVLWLTVLQPAVQNAATSAGTAAADQALNKALGTTPGTGSGSGGGASGSASGSGAGGSASPSASASPTSSASPTPAASTPAPAKPVPVLPAPVSFASELTSANGSIAATSKQQLTVTDLVLQNPAGDSGILTISDGGEVLLTTQLNDFRDYDLHFITPITVQPNNSLTMSVQCQNKGGTACSAQALITGVTHTIAF